ncbi:MAG: hypothetical protein WBF17_04040 [Phycisphaerae bacterium]
MANPTSGRSVEATGPVRTVEAVGAGQVMRKDKLLILAVFVVLVCAAVGLQQFGWQDGLTDRGSQPAPGVAPTVPGPLKPVNVDQFRGFSLQLQSHSPTHPYPTYISEIAATGANTVCLVVAAYQENCDSTSIFVDARRTPSDEQVQRLIGHAHKEGLRVVFMPIVLLENPRAGEWRGKIDPKNWDDWWEDYDNYILHYAHVAQAARAELLVVGSELVSTEKDHGNRWRGLIGRVRKVFKGHLSYSANWDHYRPVSWWDAVDIIGMTTYYDLTEGGKPTVERLLAGWRPIRKEILEWQRTINRPILFTEVGWPNQVTCAQYPWDYTRNPDKPDPTAQANCFEAFFRTWINEKAVAGFLVWEWRNHPNQKIGPEETGYVPCGKPALDVIRKYYQSPDPRSETTQPTSAPATSPASRPATRPK